MLPTGHCEAGQKRPEVAGGSNEERCEDECAAMRRERAQVVVGRDGGGHAKNCSVCRSPGRAWRFNP
ncbi:hypothetical protein ACFYVM_17870 [Streptomyces sp. NPDC003280]|uniref:hypothetical protein n=1 Tax=Streptomyces sp. NPDC003280 TaxID=3364680 RepID=UPI0036ABE1EF